MTLGQLGHDSSGVGMSGIEASDAIAMSMAGV